MIQLLSQAVLPGPLLPAQLSQRPAGQLQVPDDGPRRAGGHELRPASTGWILLQTDGPVTQGRLQYISLDWFSFEKALFFKLPRPFLPRPFLYFEVKI